MPEIVLASASPSRLSILRNAGVEPRVIVPEVDEDAVISQLQPDTPEQFVLCLAQAKARAVAGSAHNTASENASGDAVIIGADSMLLHKGTLQGKPYTVEETLRRWQAQRGTSAQLLTGHCLIHRGREYAELSTTVVHFADAGDEDIEAYARTGEPFLCAGAFTLEAIGGWFIERIEGDPSSVIGLSLPVVRRGVEHFGFHISQCWGGV